METYAGIEADFFAKDDDIFGGDFSLRIAKDGKFNAESAFKDVERIFSSAEAYLIAQGVAGDQLRQRLLESSKALRIFGRKSPFTLIPALQDRQPEEVFALKEDGRLGYSDEVSNAIRSTPEGHGCKVYKTQTGSSTLYREAWDSIVRRIV